MGENCRYNGGNNFNPWVLDFAKDKNIISVCPEVLGGMDVPRIPCEQRGEKVYNKEGEDVTHHFIEGAELAYCLSLEYSKLLDDELEGAVLKANSPSCGCGYIYDGTFTGTKIKGNGFFAKKLLSSNIPVATEEDGENFIKILKEKNND